MVLGLKICMLFRFEAKAESKFCKGSDLTMLRTEKGWGSGGGGGGGGWREKKAEGGGGGGGRGVEGEKLFTKLQVLRLQTE